MRTRTAPENTILSAAFRWHSIRVEIKNAAGTWVDRSSYLIGASFGADVDQPIAEARVQFRRDSGANSLSPLRGDSPLNVGGAAIDAGREIRISPATSAHGVAPIAGDYKQLFLGTIDSVDFANSTIEVVARDQGGALVDAWIETETSYGTEAGRPLEDVMQDLLTDWAPGVTLYTPVSPGFMVTASPWSKINVFEALRSLAGAIGWDIRYLWDNGLGAFRLTLFEPDRAKTVPDWTFAGNRYFDVTQLAISRENVRNVIAVTFTNVATAARETVTATDSASVARFGRRWMEIEEASDSPIDTTAEAQDLANAALADLAWPIAEQEIELPFFWPVDIGDLLRFSPNTVHASDPLDLAVTGYSHELAPGNERTRIAVRGKPAGFYRNWLQRATETLGPGERAVTLRLHSFREISRDATAGTVTFGWFRGANVGHVVFWPNYRTLPLTSDPWPQAGDVPGVGMIRGAIADHTVEETLTVRLPVANENLYLQVDPRGADIGTLGEVVRRETYGPQGLRSITIGGFRTIQKTYPTADVYGTVLDPEALGTGTLYVWVDTATPASPDTTGPATHFKSGVSLAAPYSFGPATTFTPTGGGAVVTPLLNITFQPAKTKSVAFRFIAADERDSGIITYTLEDFLDLVTSLGELRAGAVYDALQIATSIRPPGVGAALPADGSVFSMFLLTTDTPPALYRWDPVGAAWTKAVKTVELTGTVSTAQIADDAISTAKIAAAAVAAGKIAANAVGSNEISAGAVTAGKIAALSIVAGDIAAGAITTGKIAALAVTASEIAALAITTDKLAANAVTAGKIAANTITANELAANSVTAGAIAANQIVAGHITAGAITAAAIAADAVTATAILAGAVTAAKISVATLSAISADMGTLTAGIINNLASSPTAGIRLNTGYAKPGTWTSYLDLAAASTDPFLQHPALSLLANGNATFSGTVSSTNFTAATAFFANLQAANVYTTGVYTSESQFQWRNGAFGGYVKAYSTTDSVLLFRDTGLGDGIDIDTYRVVVRNITFNGAVVSVGAADSGGSGLRALTVPN